MAPASLVQRNREGFTNRFIASIAGIPVSLNGALPGIDRRNASLVIGTVAPSPPDFQA